MQSRLVNGTQSSGNLFKRKEPSFKRLAQEITLLIKKYYDHYKHEDSMFIKAFPKTIEFSSSWFVKMQTGGHLSSHIHEEGWISGAVYLSIPQQKKHPDEGGIELSVLMVMIIRECMMTLKKNYTYLRSVMLFSSHLLFFIERYLLVRMKKEFALLLI